jgi:hypothetical protein
MKEREQIELTIRRSLRMARIRFGDIEVEDERMKECVEVLMFLLEDPTTSKKLEVYDNEKKIRSYLG